MLLFKLFRILNYCHSKVHYNYKRINLLKWITQ